MMATPGSALEPPGPSIANKFGKRALHYARLALDPIGTVSDRFARYGDIYRVTQRSGPLFVLKHPDHIRDVLVTHASAFGKGHSAFVRLGDVLGDGLLTSEGERWRRQRRLIQPAFSRQRLAEYGVAMVEEAQLAASELKDGQAQSLSSMMTQLTMRIVARTLFGQRLDDTSRVARAMLWLNAAFAQADLLPASIPTLSRWRAMRALADLDAAMFAMIDGRIARVAETDERPRDLLQRLLDARDEEGDRTGLERREIRDQLLTLYLAGHETTSHALSWTFYLLSRHAEARAKLAEELRRVLDGRAPRFEDLPALVYTEQVIKEAMRLYPPAFVIPRVAVEDTMIGPYAAPRGSEAVIWTYHTHRDPRLFPAPERFLPERFDEVASAARPKFAYLPFGAGQRACIGQTFAMVEAQLVVATLAQQVHFRYAARKAPKLRLGVTLAAANRLPIRVVRLQGTGARTAR